MGAITVARKPFSGTVANNVLEHGTGGINIDGCRVGTDDNLNGGRYSQHGVGEADGSAYGKGINERTPGGYTTPKGRWPANLIHDGSQMVLDGFPQTKSGGPAKTRIKDGKDKGWGMSAIPNNPLTYNGGDSGSAARFFYCAKASRKERGEDNDHPTVKPVALMRYLVRLVTPPGGVVLDPFMGSGTTGIAAKLEGFDFIGCEMSADYIEISKRRIDNARED